MNAAAKPAKILTTCDKCEGKGYLRGLAHYAAGVCFQCGGCGECEYKAYQQPAEDPAVVEAREAAHTARLAFVEAHRGMTRAQIVAKFGRVDYVKVWALHGFVGGLVADGDTDLRHMLNGLADIMVREAIAA